MFKSRFVSLLFAIVLFPSFLLSQTEIKPMQCEGSLPSDFRQTLYEIKKDTSFNDFGKKNLFGIHELFGTGKIVYGNTSAKYINSVGKQILDKNKITSKLKFYLLRSSFYNAFAADEGYVFITTSLLAQAENEGELAFVICHEIAHYLLKHNLKRYDYQLLTKAEYKNQKRKKLNTLDEYLEQTYVFSKEQEYQADSLGLLLFVKAGYNKAQAISSLNNLSNPHPIFKKYEYSFTSIEKNADTQFYTKFFDSLVTAENYRQIKHSPINVKLSLTKKDKSETNSKTHPEWFERVGRIRNMKVNESVNKIKPIPSEVKSEAICELFHFSMLNQDEIFALGLLNVLEQDFPSIANLSQWKGIALSAIYTNILLKTKEWDSRNPEIELEFKQDNFLQKMMAHLFCLSKDEVGLMCLFYNRNDQGVNGIINRYYSNLIKPSISKNADLPELYTYQLKKGAEKVITLQHKPFNLELGEVLTLDTNWIKASSIWNADKFSVSSRIAYDLIGPGVDIENPQIFKDVEEHMVLLVSPSFIVIPTKKTYKYVKDPILITRQKEIFARELMQNGKRQSIKYEYIGFEDKSSLSTAKYNQFYLAQNILLELIALEGSKVCPISLPFSQELSQSTGAKAIQFIQIHHIQRKSQIRVGSILMEMLAMYAVPFVYSDMGGVLANKNITTVSINCLIDLEKNSISHLGYNHSSFTLAGDNLAALALWIEYDTKKALLK